MVFEFDLTLGMPHTNRRGLWEPSLLMQAGHFQWQAISRAIGRPLSGLRTVSGAAVYAAFYYIEQTVPDQAPLESYGVDDELRFSVALRAFKNITVEGRVTFGRPGDVSTAGDRAGRTSTIRFANIFMTPALGNSELKVAPPAAADFSAIPPLPNDDNPYHLTRVARDTGSLGLFDEQWAAVGEPFQQSRAIDPDRDTNGAGLVYFAHYVTFMEACERAFCRSRDPLSGERSLRQRRTAYFGNAEMSDTLQLRAVMFRRAGAPGRRGFRFTITRERDAALICISEVIKAVETGAAP